MNLDIIPFKSGHYGCDGLFGTIRMPELLLSSAYYVLLGSVEKEDVGMKLPISKILTDDPVLQPTFLYHTHKLLKFAIPSIIEIVYCWFHLELAQHL